MTRMIEAIADGLNVSFSFPFTVTADETLEVRLDGVTQQDGYAVHSRAGVGALNGAGGGVVLFDAAPAAGTVVDLRQRGAVTVTVQDSVPGHLADKLAAGTGIRLDTATAADGSQSLTVTAEKDPDCLNRTLNLADLTDTVAARTNLDVYSKAEADAVGDAVKADALLKAANLSDLINVATARTNLGVYAKTEVNALDAAVRNAALLKADNLSGLGNVATARTNLSVYSKAEVDARDTAVKNTLLTQITNLQNQLDGLDFSGEQLLAPNGYQKLPGGLILQWCVAVFPGLALNTTVTLPTSFSNTCLFAIAGSIKNTYPKSIPVDVVSWDSSTVSLILHSQPSTTTRYMASVLAIGY